MKKIAIVAVALALSACQTTRIRSGCPVLVSYSPATMKQAAKELRALPPGTTLERFLQDYHRERDALRLCR